MAQMLLSVLIPVLMGYQRIRFCQVFQGCGDCTVIVMPFLLSCLRCDGFEE